MPSPGICSLADLKSAIDIVEGSEQFDTELWRMATLATTLIEQAIRRELVRQTITEYFNSRENYSFALDLQGSGFDIEADRMDVSPSTYKLSGYPIAPDAAFELWYSPSRVYDAETLVSPERYSIEHEKERVILLFPTIAAPRAIRVRYEAGYDLDYAEGSATYHADVEDTSEVDTNMTLGGGLVAIFDGNSATAAAASASVAGEEGWVSISYENPQIISRVRWSCPTDQAAHAGASETTIRLEGASDTTFSDASVLATRTVRALAPGEDVTLRNSSKTPYAAYRVSVVYPGAATTYCADLELTLLDMSRAYLSGLPDELRTGGALLTKFLFQKNRSSGFGMERGGDGDMRFTTKGAIPKEVLQMIMPYRKFLRA